MSKYTCRGFAVSTMLRSSGDSLIADLVGNLGPLSLRVDGLGKEDKDCSENDKQRYRETLECRHLGCLIRWERWKDLKLVLEGRSNVSKAR